MIIPNQKSSYHIRPEHIRKSSSGHIRIVQIRPDHNNLDQIRKVQIRSERFRSNQAKRT